MTEGIWGSLFRHGLPNGTKTLYYFSLFGASPKEEMTLVKRYTNISTNQLNLILRKVESYEGKQQQLLASIDSIINNKE